MKQIQKLVALALLLFAGTLNASAQEKGFTWGASGISGGTGKDFILVNLQAYTGYNFTDDFGAFLEAETSFSAITEEARKSYITQSLGLMLKYNVYKFDKGIVDVRANVGKSITTKEWDYLYWDLGCYLQAAGGKTKPTLGLGFRQYHTLTEGGKNHPAVYVSVGFTFN